MINIRARPVAPPPAFVSLPPHHHQQQQQQLEVTQNINHHHPVASNQKVNVDSNVLSQDVDMHVPPIVFKNQDNNDIPITSGTYVHIPDVFLPGQLRPTIHNFLHTEPHSPFKVDIQSVNFGMSNEDISEMNGSAEETDGHSAQSHGAAVDETDIDQHKDDDFANEQGEVIQESNAVPQLISSDQSLIDQAHLNRIPDDTKPTAKPTTKSIDKIQKTPFTQTESNDLWQHHPSTTEYSQMSSSKRTTPFTTPATATKLQNPIQSNRIPSYTMDHAKLNLPHVAPSMVNDMYATPVAGVNRTQPIGFNISSTAIRNSNKQSLFGHLEPRPPKLHPNIAHHGSIFSPPNPPTPSQYPTAIYGDKYAGRPHQPRRPISLNQKPFSRFPVHYSNPTLPTSNLTGPHMVDQSVKPNWLSGKPFDANAHRPNVFFTTTKYPAATVAVEQALPTSGTPIKQYQHHHHYHHGHQSMSTQKPFTKYTPADAEFGAKVPPPSANATKVVPSRAKATQRPYDLSRGKPFVFAKPSPSTSVLNIGEEKRPVVHTNPMITNMTNIPDANASNDGAEIFDFKESINPHNFASVTEHSATTESAVNGITSAENAAPFGHKNRIPASMVPETVYPKTPATDMQPPPTYTPKYQNSYLHSKPSPATTYQNVRVEEVMGMNPPPIPRLPIKLHKQPEIQGNYGKIALHHVHQVSFSLKFLRKDEKNILFKSKFYSPRTIFIQ